MKKLAFAVAVATVIATPAFAQTATRFYSDDDANVPARYRGAWGYSDIAPGFRGERDANVRAELLRNQEYYRQHNGS